MNIEYIKLENGNTLVTDENSNIKERENLTEEELMLENKLEIIEDELEEINEEIGEKNSNCRDLKKLNLMISILYPSIYAVLLVYGVISKDFSPFETLGGVTGTCVMCGIAGTAVALSYLHFILPSKRRLKDLKNVQTATLELERKYQLELSKVKEKNITLQEAKSLQTNKVVSLEEKTELARESLEEEFKENYNKINVKPKKRVLKRNDF